LLTERLSRTLSVFRSRYPVLCFHNCTKWMRFSNPKYF